MNFISKNLELRYTGFNSPTDIPSFIKYNAAVLYHQQFYKYIKELQVIQSLPLMRFILNYLQFNSLKKRNIFYVNRQKESAAIEVVYNVNKEELKQQTRKSGLKGMEKSLCTSSTILN